MPELPEVETVVRDLRPLLQGRILRGIRTGPHQLRQPWQTAWNKILVGTRIETLERRGKWILVHLDSKPRLLLHLGMTGQLTVHGHRDPVADHVHIVYELDNKHELRFRDTRRFGSAALFDNYHTLSAYLDDRLGPEPFDIDADYFRNCMKATNRPLKAVLLDQKILAGVGNIYADESCFLARLHPGRRADTLNAVEADRLRLAIETILRHAVDGRGSTIRDYIGGSGLKGTFQDAFAVYGRDGKPCMTCQSIIEVIRIAGRSSHFCPECQPISTRRTQRPPGKSKVKS